MYCCPLCESDNDDCECDDNSFIKIGEENMSKIDFEFKDEKLCFGVDMDEDGTKVFQSFAKYDLER